MPTPPKGAKVPSDRKSKSAAKAASVGGYGAGWGAQLFDFTTPSGTMCQLRVLDPSVLIKAGILDSVDAASAIVSSVTIPTAEGHPPMPKSAEELMENPEQLKGMLDLIDKVTMLAVVQPKLNAAPTANDLAVWNASHDEDEQLDDPDDLRVEGAIYIDMIPTEDRAAIMGAALGGEINELDTFRSGSESAVAGSAAVEATGGASE